jgi:hypothetical protein
VHRTHAVGAGSCTLVASEESLTIQANGGSAPLSLAFENYSGASPPRVTPSTPNWADIMIVAEPRKPEDGASLRFSITSVSGKTGSFAVTFATPCGKLDLPVNVR